MTGEPGRAAIASGSPRRLPGPVVASVGGLLLAAALLALRFGDVPGIPQSIALGGAGAALAALASRARRPGIAWTAAAGALGCGLLALRAPGAWTLAFVVAALGVTAAALAVAGRAAAREPGAVRRAAGLLLIVAATVGARALLLDPQANRFEDWLLLDHVRELSTPSPHRRGVTTTVLLGLAGLDTFDALFALNTVACALCAVPAFFLARSWFRDALAGWAAAVLVAVHPFLLGYGRTGDYHAVGNLAFLGALAAAFAHRDRGDGTLPVLAWGLAAACVATQTELLPLLVVALPAIAFGGAGPGPRRADLAVGAVAFGIGLAPRVQAFLTPVARDVDATGAPHTLVGTLGARGGIDSALAGAAQVAAWTVTQVPPALAALVVDLSRVPASTLLGLAGLAVLWRPGRRRLAVALALGLLAIVVLYYGTHRSAPGEHPHQDVLPVVLLATLAGGALAWVWRSLAGLERGLVGVAMAVALGVSVVAGFGELEDRAGGQAACDHRTLDAWFRDLPDGATVCSFNPERLRDFGRAARGLRRCDARAGAAAAPDPGTPVWIVVARSLTQETPEAARDADAARARALAFADAIGVRVADTQAVQCGGPGDGDTTLLMRAVPVSRPGRPPDR